MSAFSDYLETTLINATLRGGTYTGGAVYIALFTADPTDSSLSVELVDSKYKRQQAHLNTVGDGFTAPVDGSTSNSHIIQFPAIADSEVTVTHWGIFDALTGGNLLYHANAQAPRTAPPLTSFVFPANSLTVVLS